MPYLITISKSCVTKSRRSNDTSVSWQGKALDDAELQKELDMPIDIDGVEPTVANGFYQ